MGGNYGPTIAPSQKAQALDCAQVMWLFGPEHQVTEVGAMNILFAIRRRDSDVVELTTAPLSRGDILPGRQNIHTCIHACMHTVVMRNTN